MNTIAGSPEIECLCPDVDSDESGLVTRGYDVPLDSSNAPFLHSAINRKR